MATPHPAFDELAALRPLLDACVHCGFCLPACPSYAVTGQEMDSPRGRILVMAAGTEGRTMLTPSAVAHFDTCLGCMACETACPSGVRYAPLIEHTRSAIETHHTRSMTERLLRRALFFLLPFPGRLRIAAIPLMVLGAAGRAFARAGLLRLLPGAASAALALIPTRTWSQLRVRTPSVTRAAGAQRLRVGLLTGCAQRALFDGINHAASRVLAAEGCEVVAPRQQGCCGALALHAGYRDEARRAARDLIQTFDAASVDRVAVSTAGCGSAMKEYGELLADDPEWAERARCFAARVADVTEVLVDLTPSRAPRHPIPLRVAYHDACHLAHAQGVRAQPRALLHGIPGVTLVPLAESDLCCGSAGVYNLLQPDMGAALGERKAARVAESGADAVVTTNIGCMMQIDAAARVRGGPRPVYHLVELLDASIRNAPLSGKPA